MLVTAVVALTAGAQKAVGVVTAPTAKVVAKNAQRESERENEKEKERLFISSKRYDAAENNPSQKKFQREQTAKIRKGETLRREARASCP
jgi:hypothetical protein